MTCKRRRLAARRRAVGFSQEQLAEQLGVERSTVVRWESGETENGPQPWLRPKLARALQVSVDQLAELLIPEVTDERSTVRSTSDTEAFPPALTTTSDGQTDSSQIELLRQAIDDALNHGSMAEASLDDWERNVIRHGRASRSRPATLLLNDLSIDLAVLRRALEQHRSASALRRLTRVAAHMCGLMCLTFCKLDDRAAFRRWARTGRLAADEAGDTVTHSWILAQEAYGYYYSGDFSEAVDVARHAQRTVRLTPCVGTALAAALEARAHAAMGHREETHEALGRAEDVLDHLDGEALVPSAFGYNEAQLRFHASNAYTRLGDINAAFEEQERAIALCMPGDYTDWAMTRLDRASCMTLSGDVLGSIAYATETLSSLTDPQRRGIILLRGLEVWNGLSRQDRNHRTAHELHEILMATPEPEEV